MAMVSSSLLPADEALRLRSIRRYDVRRTLQETIFTELVALTARIFDVPISLIALVDDTEVWYQANHGLPDVHVQPREESLCATAILHNKGVVYADLATETSALITPQVAAAAQANELRFYAAAPLCMPDEQRIGAVCVIDREPRTFSTGEQQLLHQMAALISTLITVRACCLHSPQLGAEQWQLLRVQVQEEIQGLVALVRYLHTRHGTQTPVPQDMLTLVSHRLDDLHEILEEYEC